MKVYIKPEGLVEMCTSGAEHLKPAEHHHGFRKLTGNTERSNKEKLSLLTLYHFFYEKISLVNSELNTSSLYFYKRGMKGYKAIDESLQTYFLSLPELHSSLIYKNA